ncbi:GNAT family N-acetyltransferase [Pseudomonas qingdaonensis]|uniref:GNAT family N-acetyltransferase n=1 Tax=Pseudomonas qingdaonensis TaxID=2056231 RepID=UPI001F48A6D6|nr:GNAT family protein [Pseudomonas qingdaonensis]
MQEYYLRELSCADAPVLNRWRNDRPLVGLLGAPYRYIAEEIDANWVSDYLRARSNCVRLAICVKDTGQVIGAAYLLSIDWIARSSEFAIWIGEKEFRSKGVGRFATTKVLEHAFHDLNLNRVHLTVLEDNKSAFELYRKLGFSVEGFHREAVYKEGKYLNMVAMSILAAEFSSGF